MKSQASEQNRSRHAETRLRVRYAETDKMGVVYYSNYLVWMEIGRTDFCIEAGFRYSDLENKEGIAIAVADANCRYRAPARYDDEILIRTTLTRIRSRTMSFSYQILDARTEALLAEAHTTHVSVGTSDGRPRALPADYYALLKEWENPTA